MMDLSDAVARLCMDMNDALWGIKRKKTEKHAPVEIGGSVLRYTSHPGKSVHVNETDAARDRHWRTLRRKIANGARIK